MSLQTDNLAMIGLGVLGNQPVNSYQSPLADGIHLRWGFLRELGFPWHGFYLFRRPALPGRPLCLSSVIGGLKKGNWPDNKHYTAIGLLSSNTNLVLTEDFMPGTQVEFALDGRNHLRFDLPTGELARLVKLRVGFRPQRCLEFDKLIELPAPAVQSPPPTPDRGGSIPPVSVIRPNPLNLQGVIFEVKDRGDQPASKTQFDLFKTASGQLLGLGCGYGLTIKLPVPSNAVELLITRIPTIVPVGTQFIIEAFDSHNNKVATAQMQNLAGQLQTIQLSGQNITRIEVPTTRDNFHTVYLHRICADKLSVESGKAGVKVTAFSGTTPVRSVNISGQAGKIVSTTLEADAISAVEISSGPAALVDLCYVPVAQAATQGWKPLPGFSYPMGLPVSQADYPCSVADPESLLAQRVRYQLPSGWDATSFAQLHDQLVTLVEGGPSAAPMVDRIFAAPQAVSNPPDPDPPKLSKFYVLDMILLGSLHPALAQLVGLYWVDQTAALDVAYDYLIVADHTGVGKRSADKVLRIIKTDGFAQLDGYIVFNKRLAAAPPLPAPDGLQAYELPGGTFPDAQGQLPQASNNAGLRWEIGWNDSGALLPERAVMYLVWRADLGNAATPAPAVNHDLVTKLPPNKPRPIMVTESRLPGGVVPQRSPDWPPVPLHFIDRNLKDGWYSYLVSGIDLFGLHSLNSAPVQLRLLDRIPPPVPTGVEAYALDPADPFLQRDAAYQDWHKSLAVAVRQTLIGLRVRWRWTKAHQQQAPDTSEFRIYFHPGSDLPPAHDLAQNWQERFHVVGYNQYFYSINPTHRNFPKIGGTAAVSITAASGAKWWAVSSDPSWITITSGSSGSGNGTVTYSVASNPGAPRTGTLKIAGHKFIINQQDASSTLPVSPPVSAQEDRVYEIFLPLPSTTTPVGLPLNPSLAEPVVYANIGVSAADDKPHTNDQRATGSWGNRPGNEGRIGPTAKIYRVLRAKPAPPAALADAARVYATPADYHNRSFYTYRWQTPNQADNLKLHLFRAMDDAIIKADWFIRTTRIALEPANPQHQRFFPQGWSQNVSRQKAAANALNAITSQANYNTLSNDAKKLLARLPGNDGVKDFNALKQRDWSIRQSRQNLSASALNAFSSWDSTRRQAVATELNTFVLYGAKATPAANNALTLAGAPDLTRVRPYRDIILLKSDTQRADRQYRITASDAATFTLTLDETPSLTGGQSAWAIPLYQTLSDNALQALAMLPGNESAFIQLTIDPLDAYEADPEDPTKLRWRDRRGPDNADDFPLHPNAAARRAYIDTLDGRSTNRYLYRAAFVDAAHNQGELGLPGPVVYLPNVVPPRAPVITKVLGGEREITLKWASNREPDLAEYRVYRADSEEATRDLRLMTLKHTEAVAAGDPATRPAEVSWTDTPVVGLTPFYYCLVAVDDAGNVSLPSRAIVGQAYDYGSPAEPEWERSEWVKLDASGVEHAYTEEAADLLPVVALVFTTTQGNVAALVQRQNGTWHNVSAWQRSPVHDAGAGVWRFTFYDRTAQPSVGQRYRGRLITTAGVSLDSVNEREVAAP